MKKYRIGIDAGATNIKVGLFTDEMDLIATSKALTDRELTLDQMMQRLEGLVRRILSQNNAAIDNLEGVGLVFPYHVDHKRGYVLDNSFVLSLANAPVRDLLSKRLGTHVYIDNDANAAALAEHTMGAGTGHEDMVYVALSTGIGGGLILNNKLFRGMHGIAGEIGHMIVSDSCGYSCKCGSSGCVNSIASGTSMARYAIDLIKEGEDSSILDYAGTFSQIDMVAVGKALNTGDPLAKHIVSRGAEYLARMLHSLNQMLDVNVFVYGGGLAKLGPRFIDSIIGAYRRYSTIDKLYPAEFLPARFGDQAGMYGAALLVSSDRFHSAD